MRRLRVPLMLLALGLALAACGQRQQGGGSGMASRTYSGPADVDGARIQGADN